MTKLLLKAKDIAAEALLAEKKIRPYIRETPVEFSPHFSRKTGCKIFLKLENFQLTGSFKLRGAVNKILSLHEKERSKEVITASSGNHGVAVAYSAEKFGIQATIYVPENASKTKIESLRLYEINLKQFGNDCIQAETIGRKIAEEEGLAFISPYNDLQIIAGQATIGVELTRQLNGIDSVIVPVGGGGLISGIAGFLKSVNKNIEIIGCQPENSPVMYQSLQEGRILDLKSKPTLSDGTAGGIEPASITFDICRQYVDDFILVSEEEISNALVTTLEKHHILIEGAAALSVAAFLKSRERFRGKTVVLVISGAKISLETLKKVLQLLP